MGLPLPPLNLSSSDFLESNFRGGAANQSGPTISTGFVLDKTAQLVVAGCSVVALIYFLKRR